MWWNSQVFVCRCITESLNCSQQFPMHPSGSWGGGKGMSESVIFIFLKTDNRALTKLARYPLYNGNTRVRWYTRPRFVSIDAAHKVAHMQGACIQCEFIHMLGWALSPLGLLFQCIGNEYHFIIVARFGRMLPLDTGLGVVKIYSMKLRLKGYVPLTNFVTVFEMASSEWYLGLDINLNH